MQDWGKATLYWGRQDRFPEKSAAELQQMETTLQESQQAVQQAQQRISGLRSGDKIRPAPTPILLSPHHRFKFFGETEINPRIRARNMSY